MGAHGPDIDLVRIPTLPWPFTHLCRGPSGCGMPLGKDDVERHLKHHQAVSLGGVEVDDLSEFGGANEVPPLPPKET